MRASSRGIQKRAITSVNQAILAEKYQAEPKILKNTSNQQKTKFKKKLSKKNKKKVLLPEEKNGKTSQLFIIIIYINFIIITIFIPTFAFKNLAHNLSFAYNTFLSALFASELQPRASQLRKSLFFQEIFYEKTSRNSIQEKPLFQFFFQVLFLFLFLFQNCKKRWTTSQVFSLSSSSPLKYQLYIYEKISTNLLNITCNDFLPSIMFNREVKQLSKRNVSHTVFFSVHS